jgi:hypothetical protein
MTKSETNALSATAFVMRGLDPRIHELNSALDGRTSSAMTINPNILILSH